MFRTQNEAYFAYLNEKNTSNIIWSSHMGRHIKKWAKLNFVARHYDPHVPGHNGHNGVRENSTWPI